ncbi:MAG: hypothetical protein ACRYG8_30960 [Janthinobacterium lividum]
MLTGRGNAENFALSIEKDRLSREADEAFAVGDSASCIDAINQLYELLDETLTTPRHGGRGPLRRAWI